jgi:penicillin-binding protein 2
VQAIERSCDSYFYDLALRVGINRIEAMARRFGFGVATGVDLQGEKSGIVPGRDWKRANYDIGWRPGETVITGIGQGYLLSTPMQLAVMTACLANGGKIVKPRVTKPAEDEEIETTNLNLDEEAMAIIRRGLYAAVNRPDGTAYASSLLIDGQRMSGKTGTVQVRRISLAERETGVIPNSELDWHLRDHSLFVGYVPHDKPRFAISVVIEHGGGGAQVAAPIARDAMIHLLRSDKFKTKPAAMPESDTMSPSEEQLS